MRKKWLWITLLGIIVFYGIISLYYYTFTLEGKFRRIGLGIAKEFAESTSPVGPKHAVSDAEREKTFARQGKLLKKWQDGLRDLIKQDPESIWADDAQYLIAALNTENPLKEAKEMETLLTDYPDFRIEEWTKKYLVILVGSNISPLTVTLTLCMLYKKINEFEKLKSLCEEAMKRFPQEAYIFESILKSASKPFFPKKTEEGI